MTQTPSTVVPQVEQAARDREAAPGFPASYVGRVRAAATRMAAVEVAADDMRSALAIVDQHLPIDVDVPISSSQRATAVVKKVVRKLTIFYVRYAGQQVTLLGQATVRFGEAVTQRVERLEGHVERLEDLEARVERLEQQLSQ